MAPVPQPERIDCKLVLPHSSDTPVPVVGMLHMPEVAEPHTHYMWALQSVHMMDIEHKLLHQQMLAKLS